ncbi:hypothetical protein [Haloarchaeobius sp. TZWWS8]|uniref:hypothetical protein n=1 Tax=Haloarchaeobius sp. TZWWS8 TaxID=3446121 RepID=UPI003EBFAB09
MATNSAHPTTRVDVRDEGDSTRRRADGGGQRGGVGLHHLTVVPTNFERDARTE